MKTLVLWLDGFREDYISKENTPFLYSLKEKYGCGLLKPSFGFSQASWFTGLVPEKHGQLGVYCLRNKKTFWPRLVPKKLVPYFFSFFRYIAGKDFVTQAMRPKDLMKFKPMQDKFFHHKNVLGVKSLFDYIPDVKYLMFYWPLVVRNGKTKLSFFRNDNSKTKKFLELMNDEDLFLFELSETDQVGHIYGIDSPEIKEQLKKTDKLIKRIINRFDLKKDNIIVWSDHGMLEVKKVINLEKFLPNDSDYDAIIEGTTVRFWFRNEKIKKKILEIFSKVKEGHFLSPEEKKKYESRFKDNKNGDEIFLVNPGVLIIPNAFQQKPAKGMHGYNLEDKREWGIFLANRKFKKNGKIIDILPSLLKLFDKKANVEGKSLF
jgi:predicted AlkP superfamily pyrophosphatase or phosphodiesterase